MKIYLEKIIIHIFLFILISHLIFIIKTQESPEDSYDPCAYVGTSMDERIPQFCLDTDINCCYFAFKWKNPVNELNEDFVYYSCVNKKRLLMSTFNDKNLTSSFLYDTSDETYTILSRILYVNCTDPSGVILSKSNMIPPKMSTKQRMLNDNYDNNNHRINFNNTYSEDYN